MIKNKYLLNQTLQYYSSIQSKISQEKFLREESLLQNEEYSKVSFELKGVIFDLEKAIYQNDEKLAKELSTKKKDLQKRKNEILKSLPGEQTFKYDCNACQDKGVLPSGEYCNCFYKTLTRFALEFLGAKSKTLYSFSQNAIKNGDKDYALSQKLEKYATDFTTNSKNLMFLGEAGTGKTFFANAITSKVKEKNYNALYFTACEFNQILLNYHLANEYEKNIFYDILTTSDLLVIDDLGTEPILKNVTLEYLLLVISERLINGKPFIITTNLKLNKLELRYGQRLASRLNGKSVTRIEFIGKDLR